jgi:hypothetical protein
MEIQGDFIETDQPFELSNQQDRRGKEEPASQSIQPPSPAPSGPVDGDLIIRVPRPAEERAGIFLKDWVRRFTRM